MLKQLLSPDKIVEQLKAVWQRFPITVLYVIIGTVFAILEIWDFLELAPRTFMALWTSLSLGAMLSLAIYQWVVALGRHKSLYIAQGIALAISLGNFIAVYYSLIPMNDASATAYGAAYTALAVAIGFMPPIAGYSDKQQWSYSIGVLGALAIATVIAITLAIASVIIEETLRALFSVDYHWLLTLSVLFAVTLPTMLFFGFLPSPAEVNEDSETPGLSFAIFCKNVILPLALVYTAILYCYTLKILFTWSLPQGGVTWMVTGLVCVCLIIIYGVQGFIYSPAAKPTAVRIAHLAGRWLPIALLPLLVLMSVAIGYRVWEYGITPSRLYVLTFNVWAYAVIFYLLFEKNRHLNSVATSFALIFLLTSIIPGANYYTWGMKYVQNKVRTNLTTVGLTELPVTVKQLKDALSTAPKDLAESLARDISYLDDWNDHSLVAPFVTSPDKISYYELSSGITDVVAVDDTTFDVRVNEVPLAPIPTGYQSMRRIDEVYYPQKCSTDGIYNMGCYATTVPIPVDSLLRNHNDVDFKPLYIDVDSVTTAVITRYSLKGDSAQNAPCYSKIEINGYLLKR